MSLRAADLTDCLLGDTRVRHWVLSLPHPLRQGRPAGYDPFSMQGRRIGGYLLGEPIGAGGAGTVYRARQLSLDRDVAFKILHPELAREPAMRERFLREGRLAARVTHPNLVQVLEAGEEPDLLYLVLELIEGRTLREELAEVGALDLPRTLQVARQCADVLAVLHQSGIVHRDVKPENLFLHRDRGLLLGDLGIAREEGPSRQPTAEGTLLGTPAYMAPEVISGKPAGPPSDLYALGVVIYECLAGAPPFSGDDVMAILEAHVRSPAPPLPPGLGQLPPGLIGLIDRALGKNPADRPASAVAIRDQVIRISRRFKAPGSAPETGTPTIRLATAPPGGGARRRRDSTRTAAATIVSGRSKVDATKGWRPGQLLLGTLAVATLVAAAGLVSYRSPTGPKAVAIPRDSDPADSRALPNLSDKGGAKSSLAPGPSTDSLAPKSPNAAVLAAIDQVRPEVARTATLVHSALFQEDGVLRTEKRVEATGKTTEITAKAEMAVRRLLVSCGSTLASLHPAETESLGRLLLELLQQVRAARDNLERYMTRKQPSTVHPLEEMVAHEVWLDDFDSRIASRLKLLLDQLPPEAVWTGTLNWDLGVLGLKSLLRPVLDKAEWAHLRKSLLTKGREVSKAIGRSVPDPVRATDLIQIVKTSLQRIGYREEAADLYDSTLVPYLSRRQIEWFPHGLGLLGRKALFTEMETRWSPDPRRASREELLKAQRAWEDFRFDLREARREGFVRNRALVARWEYDRKDKLMLLSEGWLETADRRLDEIAAALRRQ